MKKFFKCFLVLFLTITLAKNVYVPVLASQTVVEIYTHLAYPQ